MARQTYVHVKYKCKNGHLSTRVPEIEKRYEPLAKCDSCEEVGEVVKESRNNEPVTTFTERLYPYFDPALDRPFHSPKERAEYLKANDLYTKDGKGHSNAKKDARLMQWRLHTGRHKVD